MTGPACRYAVGATPCHSKHGGKHAKKDCAAPTVPGAPAFCDVLGPVKDKVDDAYGKFCPPEKAETPKAETPKAPGAPAPGRSLSP